VVIDQNGGIDVLKNKLDKKKIDIGMIEK